MQAAPQLSPLGARLATLVAAAVVACSSAALAQLGAPISGGASGGLPAKAADMLSRGHVYDSQRLLAAFHFEEKLQVPGSPVFSAARVVAMRPDSPLQGLGLRVGDVVTRLDGTPVGDGKWPNQEGCFWMLPELERHFRVTAVRYIRRGTTDVREDSVDLGPRCRPQVPDSLLP